MDVCVARQPIFDRDRGVYGYELLYRSNAARNEFDGTEAVSATKQLISSSVISIGLDQLLCGKKAFVNFDERLLSEKVYLSLPRQGTVIEILESVTPSSDLIALCRSVREQGYTLALDDFVFSPQWEPLTNLAQVIKIDVRATGKPEQQRLLRTYRAKGIAMLAEKVETNEEFEWCRSAGYDYFQGYFFARPSVIQRQQVPPAKLNCIRLLAEVQKTELDFKRLEALIATDVALTYKLLRYVNSALFGRQGQIESIEHALVIAGSDNLRRWAALVTLPMLATDKPGELATLSILRARFCENLMTQTGTMLQNEAFLTGMFSLLDALLDRPLEDALKSVGLKPEITGALLGTAPARDVLARIYRLARSYEIGDWDQAAALSQVSGFSVAGVGEAYAEAAGWAERMLRNERG